MGNLGQELMGPSQHNFNLLFEAIWINAIKEELDRIRKEINYRAFYKAYDIYVIKGGELKGTDKRFLSFKRDINKFINLNNEDIKARIQDLVYIEAKEWPDGSNRLRVDKELKALVKELEILTIDFARERMLNRWNKI